MYLVQSSAHFHPGFPFSAYYMTRTPALRVCTLLPLAKSAQFAFSHTMDRLWCFVFFASYLISFALAQSPPNESAEACPVVLPPGNIQTSSRQQRIINGTLPTGGLESVMALIVNKSGDVFCSGTLVAESWVLSAACVLELGEAFVRIGGKGQFDGIIRNISKIVTHPLFEDGSFLHDIQLLRLSNPAPTSSDFVQLNTQVGTPLDFAFIRVAGYGRQLEDEDARYDLQQVDLPVVPFIVCQERYSISSDQAREELNFCAGYSQGGCGICDGDAGGPAFVLDEIGDIVQVGIALFKTEEGCARENSPDGYGRISSHIKWIQETVSNVRLSDTGQNILLPTGSVTPTSPSVASSPPPSPRGSPQPDPKPKPDESTTPTPTQTPTLTPTPIAQRSESPLPEIVINEPDEKACFPAGAMALLANGLEKTLHKLSIGDIVQVGPSQFSEVIMFTHRLHGGMYDFLFLHSTNLSLPLMLSPGHILPVNREFMPAVQAKVGDLLLTGNGSSIRIAKITKGKMPGLFNPQTRDGRIIVNGVVATTYTTAVPVTVAHALLAPVRHAVQIARATGLALRPRTL